MRQVVCVCLNVCSLLMTPLLQRAELSKRSDLTPVTLDSFEKWKKDRLQKRQAEAVAETQRKEAAAKAGRAIGMSGRDLFSFRPELFQVMFASVRWRVRSADLDPMCTG
jgi:hypothetical protein